MSTDPTALPEPPDRALVALVDPTDQEVPSLFERDDTASRTLYRGPDERRWFPADTETEVQKVHTWAGVLAHAAELGFRVVRLYREDDPAVAVIPQPEGESGVTILPATFTVSALPDGDRDRRHYQMVVRRRPGNRWEVGTQYEGECVDAEGNWSWGRDSTEVWRAAHWLTWDQAVAVATAAARRMECNGRTVEQLLASRAEADR